MIKKGIFSLLLTASVLPKAEHSDERKERRTKLSAYLEQLWGGSWTTIVTVIVIAVITPAWTLVVLAE